LSNIVMKKPVLLIRLNADAGILKFKPFY